jgi:hypothetical protein
LQDHPSFLAGEEIEMKQMREEQIPNFVRAVVATGCDIRAVGPRHFVIDDTDLPRRISRAAKLQLERIEDEYGCRDHLRAEIAAYLYSIGRGYQPPEVAEPLVPPEGLPGNPSRGQRMVRSRAGTPTDPQTEERLAAEAIALFGENAPVAIAYCGLDAWFEGNVDEGHQWSWILRRLSN